MDDGSLSNDQEATMNFPEINRITMDPAMMGGKPCIRGMRVTAGMITGLIASGTSFQEVVELYPYLERCAGLRLVAVGRTRRIGVGVFGVLQVVFGYFLKV